MLFVAAACGGFRSKGGRGLKWFHQILLIATFVPLCWFAMMAVHECGHVAAAWATGGSVNQVVLHPLAISRTDVKPNPQPLIVVWAGPLFGVLAPLAVWAICFATKLPGAYLLRFFAGVCCICNGAYISIGSIEGIGDCRGMLQHGSPIWALWLFGLLTLPAGFALWNGLGPHFGFSRKPATPGEVDRWAAYGSCVALLLYLGAAVTLSARA